MDTRTSAVRTQAGGGQAPSRPGAADAPPGPPADIALPLPVERARPPRTRLGRWLFASGTRATVPVGGRAAAAHEHAEQRPWYSVLWLTGVDYFSTLGYQPGIALLAAGALSPVATAVLVLVTLVGALPVYGQVAGRSFIGQGSIAMLEKLLSGWTSKLVVLALLGFAATDFVITMTLSAADAAQHIAENPFARDFAHGHQVALTLGLLALLAAVFLRGFGEAMGMAVAVGLPYMALNLVVIAGGAVEIARHPEALANWKEALTHHGDATSMLLVAFLVFPKLALGLSGFETGVSVMPLVRGTPGDAEQAVPHARVAATRRLLTAAAVIMSVMLLGSSFVCAVLIPESAWREGGPAAGRALAYLAHGLFGPHVGTIYDVSTILILWFAGASAMAGLLNLVPRYLPRFGMAPRWVEYSRPLVLVLFGVCVLVTLVFRADVEAQGGAYATGVLVLILSAALAVALSTWREAREAGRLPLKSLFFWGVVALFAFTLADNVVVRPDGVIISLAFVLAIVVLSAVSRWRRSTELRVEKIVFADDESARLWERLRGKKINLVPVRSFGDRDLDRKAGELRRYYRVHGPLAFLHVHLRDDRSEFSSALRVRVRKSGEDFRVSVHGASAIANSIAYISELLDPISIFLGLTRQPLMSQALRYLLWGEGETGLLVYQILIRYWEWTPEDDVRPLIFLVSE